MNAESPQVTQLDVAAYRIPTDAPEADGTSEWTATTMVVVHVHAGGKTGLGYSYTHQAAASLIDDALRKCVLGCSAFAIPAVWSRMLHAVRNVGRPGLCATAISAVDSALWDLKARLLSIPLVDLLGAARGAVPVYGSGGFTSYSDDRLVEQFARWREQGVTRLKMKVGAEPERDVERVRRARRAIDPWAELYVDANGAFDLKQALRMAQAFADEGVTWFEEPVSSDDLAGLCELRQRAPAGMDVTAGEYGYDEFYFLRMLQARAVDVLQADATRCCGVTGFLRADGLAATHNTPLSSHCAPALHVNLCCASANVRHLEYFYDHARIERMLFDGAPSIIDGALAAQRERPGAGLSLRAADADEFRL